MNNLIFRQVRILDGSGGAEFIGDVSVREGRINEAGAVTEGLAPVAGKFRPRERCCVLA